MYETAQESMTELEETLGYCFQDKKLLTEALTHPTFAYEFQDEVLASNQRLEFLGDSVLGMVVAEYLFKKYTDFAEGELTRRRTLIVNRNYLAGKAKEMAITQYLLLGRGEIKMNGGNNHSNLSGAVESIIGAIYIDGGWEAAKRFIIEKVV